MTILAFDELIHLIDTGVIANGRHAAVSGTSIDLHLGPRILIEADRKDILGRYPVLDYRERTPMNVEQYDMDPEEGYVLMPGQFILAHSLEAFDVPLNMSAMLRCKSSMGRMGFEHLDAGWVDPGFEGVLTFEFVNVCQHHAIRIRPGDPVGQLVWHRHAMIDYDKSYKANGRYSGRSSVAQACKGR